MRSPTRKCSHFRLFIEVYMVSVIGLMILAAVVQVVVEGTLVSVYRLIRRVYRQERGEGNSKVLGPVARAIETDSEWTLRCLYGESAVTTASLRGSSANNLRRAANWRLGSPCFLALAR